MATQDPSVTVHVRYANPTVSIIDIQGEVTAFAETVLTNLQEWCREAEASGIRALQEFAMRLRGYALVPVHVHAA